jgi:hypothetical protein
MAAPGPRVESIVIGSMGRPYHVQLGVSPDGRELARVTPDVPEESSARVTYAETLAFPPCGGTAPQGERAAESCCISSIVPPFPVAGP